MIQHPALSNPTTLPHCLTRFHLDKPSPIPGGPIETLNLSLKRFQSERFTFVSEFSRGKPGKKWKQEGEGRDRLQLYKILSQGLIAEAVDEEQNFKTAYTKMWRDNCRDN